MKAILSVHTVYILITEDKIFSFEAAKIKKNKKLIHLKCCECACRMEPGGRESLEPEGRESRTCVSRGLRRTSEFGLLSRSKQSVFSFIRVLQN